jgi:putative colanic acid biosynthesis acetyltransferase WcaF
MVQASLFAWTPRFAYGWRNFLLRLFGAKIGKGVKIRASVKILFPWKLTVGDHSWIGDSADINCWAPITIGANVCISQHAFLGSGSHNMWAIGFDTMEQPIVIEDEVWVAVGAYVMPGLTLRRGTIITAASVILKSTKPDTIYRGNPAVAITQRPTAQRA